MTAVYVAALGALGASCRFVIMRRWPGWAALLVINLAGSFAIGMVATRSGRWVEPATFGALGVLTSYSSYALIADQIGMRSREKMIAYLLVTIIGSVALTGAGRALGG
jgi:CrcB protein